MSATTNNIVNTDFQKVLPIFIFTALCQKSFRTLCLFQVRIYQSYKSHSLHRICSFRNPTELIYQQRPEINRRVLCPFASTCLIDMFIKLSEISIIFQCCTNLIKRHFWWSRNNLLSTFFSFKTFQFCKKERRQSFLWLCTQILICLLFFIR